MSQIQSLYPSQTDKRPTLGPTGRAADTGGLELLDKERGVPPPPPAPETTDSTHSDHVILTQHSV